MGHETKQDINGRMDIQAGLISVGLSERLEHSYNYRMLDKDRLLTNTPTGFKIDDEKVTNCISIYRGILSKYAPQDSEAKTKPEIYLLDRQNIYRIALRSYTLGRNLAELSLIEDPNLIHVADEDLVRWRIISGTRENIIIDSFQGRLSPEIAKTLASKMMKLTAGIQASYIEKQREIEYAKREIPTNTKSWGFNSGTGAEVYLKSLDTQFEHFKEWDRSANGWGSK